MSDLRSRVAYLSGLAEGLDVDQSSSEGRVLSAVIDVLGDLAEQVDDLSESHGDLAEYLEEMDDDLSAVEGYLIDDDSPAILFRPDGGLTEVENGVEIGLCPECGEAIGAGAGERMEEEMTVDCPVCGASLIAVDEPIEEE